MAHHKQKGRLQLINECLSSGRYWSLDKLLNYLTDHDIIINKRTLLRDIELMKNCNQLKYHAPIEYSRKNKGYHYTDPNYSIDKIPLNAKDIQALSIAATTLSQYKYLPLMHEFTNIIDRVIRVVNRAKQQNHESILDFIYFEKAPVSLGIGHIDDIIAAIQNKETINLTYQKFNSIETFSTIIHPYFLKEYRNRWYLIALDDGKQKIKTYGLERIRKIETSHQVYIDNKSLKKEDFFNNCVGISYVDIPTESVIIEVANKQAPYFKTQPLHHSQQIIETYDNGAILVSYQLVINYEFTGILLSYGSDITVLEPLSLKNKIVEIAERIKANYHD